MKTWVIILGVVLVVYVSIDLYNHLRSRPATVEQYKFQQLQVEKDSIKVIADSLFQVVTTPIVEDAADSLVIDKLNKTLYEINKLRKEAASRPALDSGELRRFFANLP